jgi:hypothetical protein
MKPVVFNYKCSNKNAILRFYFQQSLKNHWHYMHMNEERMKEIVSLCIDQADPEVIDLIPSVYLPKWLKK